MRKKINILLLTDFPNKILQNCLKKIIFNYDIKIYTAEIDNVNLNINNVKNKLWDKTYDIIIIWSDLTKISNEFRKSIFLEKFTKNKILKDIDNFSHSIRKLSKRANHIILINWVISSSFKGYGFFDLKNNFGLKNLLIQLNLKISKEISQTNNIIQYHLDDLINKFRGNAFDEKSYYLTKVPFHNDLFKLFSEDINILINQLYGNGIKLIILDLDDTIWGGIVGDIGWKNIIIGGHNSVGESLKDFQFFLKNLSKKGISLAIASKNNEDVALKAINENPEMVLSIKDFSTWRINWEKKSQNILEILNELNLPATSSIFIDDSKFEREEVKKTIKGIIVPDLPNDKRLYREFISNLNLFHFNEITKEDEKRTVYYQNEKKRVELKSNYKNNDEWLKTLNIKITIEEIQDSNIERTHQLFNKTNQMNLSTRRLSREKILELNSDKKYAFRVFSIIDSYGEYGLTGIISVFFENNKATLKDFILSCRVFGREIEDCMLNTVLLICKKRKFSKINATYIPTERNKICFDFVKNNFDLLKENSFEMKTRDASVKFKNFKITDKT